MHVKKKNKKNLQTCKENMDRPDSQRVLLDLHGHSLQNRHAI